MAGREHSGGKHSDISINEQKVPHNPLTEAGRIVTAALIQVCVLPLLIHGFPLPLSLSLPLSPFLLYLFTISITIFQTKQSNPNRFSFVTQEIRKMGGGKKIGFSQERCACPPARMLHDA